MIKYYMAAMSLRMFSISPGTRKFYRYLGNLIGQKNRQERLIPSYYIQGAKYLIDTCKRYQVVKSGDLILDIGTGWVHWWGAILSLLFGVKATLYDIWDNRQINAFRSYFKQLQQVADDNLS